MSASSPIKAVAFDCYGTLVDFGDEAFARAYGKICAEQGIAIEGKAFFDKWMEVWRRLAQDGRSADTGTVAVVAGDGAARQTNRPGPLSAAGPVPAHPDHHTPSAGRNRSLDGPPPPYRPYREEWPEHFAICFEEFGIKGDARAAYERLRDFLGRAAAFPEALRVVETLGRRMPVAMLSNADDDFLLPALSRNGLAFPVIVSSERARAYKPHVSIFESLSTEIGLPLENLLYVGDSRFADVAGAKNAGMHAAWINRKGAANRSLEAANSSLTEQGGPRPAEGQNRRPLPPPDFEIDSLDRLLEILLPIMT